MLKVLILSTDGHTASFAERLAKEAEVRMYLDTDDVMARPNLSVRVVDSWRPQLKWADLVVATDFNPKFLSLTRARIPAIGVPGQSFAPIAGFGACLWDLGIPTARNAKPRGIAVAPISRRRVGRVTDNRGRRPWRIRRVEPYVIRYAHRLRSYRFTGCIGLSFTTHWGRPAICGISKDLGYLALARQADKYNIPLARLLLEMFIRRPHLRIIRSA